jgi:hypothetical protein
MYQQRSAEEAMERIHREPYSNGVQDGLNAYMVTLTPEEVVMFLSITADHYASTSCGGDGCEGCKCFVDTWRSVYQSLRAEHRLSVENKLEIYGVFAPSYPWSPF